MLEAGKEENFASNIPLLSSYLQGTSYNWGYVAERQNGSCMGMF